MFNRQFSSSSVAEHSSSGKIAGGVIGALFVLTVGALGTMRIRRYYNEKRLQRYVHVATFKKRGTKTVR